MTFDELAYRKGYAPKPVRTPTRNEVMNKLLKLLKRHYETCQKDAIHPFRGNVVIRVYIPYKQRWKTYAYPRHEFDCERLFNLAYERLGRKYGGGIEVLYWSGEITIDIAEEISTGFFHQ